MEDIYDEFVAHTGLEIPFDLFRISLKSYIASNAKKELPF